MPSDLFYSRRNPRIASAQHRAIRRFARPARSGRLESALGAAENRAYYEQADAIQCAAAYGFHLCQAHAFVDGNKRIAAVACEGILRLNGLDLQASDDEVIEVFLRLASSAMTRDELEIFLRERTASL